MRKSTDADDLYVYSAEDFASILSDSYVDIREIVGDDKAADVVDIVYNRLTDDAYSDD